MNSFLFAMITSKNSRSYADLALRSFFKYTKLSSKDEFVLIDNDNENNYLYDNTICNPYPKSFSSNCNEIIKAANGRNIIIISNDVVLTPDWEQPLKQLSNMICLPSCNQTHLYQYKNLQLKPSMTIDQFDNKFFELEKISILHKKTNSKSYYEKLLMGFYLFSLPAQIYEKIGYFDERFGIGGGEDVDYRLRAIQCNIPVKYIHQSYVLHFGGKTTWDGPETKTQILERNQKYFNEFSNKWGDDLANLCLVGSSIDPLTIIKKYNFNISDSTQDYSMLIKAIVNKTN